MKRESSQSKKQKLKNNSIRFIIATDVHLGHRQNHSVRKDDSFNAFEQVLSTATKENVDFVLLGGDLFDEVNPSQKTIYKCLDLLRYYVQGQNKSTLKAKWVGNEDYRFNFFNPHLGVKLPILTIHGNHDYPSNDFGKISICDLLHISNYANYFGKNTDLNNIIVKPIIIEKQNVKMKLAIYGLGYIKDPVLQKLFEQKKVTFIEPQDKSNTFCLFIFHQNRYKKGLKAGAPIMKCISSKYIPQWMDITIWGHEHQAINKIQQEDGRKIFQPGSTVITSFIQAESYPKQCLLIQIKNIQKSSQQPITITSKPLELSYRPLICKNYQISELSSKKKDFDVYTFLDQQISKILNNVEKQFPGKKPIIRIKFEYSGNSEIGRCKTLEVKYLDKVANPQSIINFWKRKTIRIQDDKTVMQQLKQKKIIQTEQNIESIEHIMAAFTNSIQNKECYYDPNLIFRFSQTYVSKDLINSKKYTIQQFEKIKHKMTGSGLKDIQTFYKTMSSEKNTLKQDIMKKINNNCKTINFDQDSDQQILPNPESNNPSKLSYDQTRKLFQLKQQQLSKSRYTKKFLNVDPKSVPESQPVPSVKNVSESQKGASKDEEVSVIKMQIQQSSISKSNSKPKSAGNVKKGPKSILKKKSNDEDWLDLQEHEIHEQDCCKKAEGTQYDEISAKANFESANHIIHMQKGQQMKKQSETKQQRVTRSDKGKRKVRFENQ